MKMIRRIALTSYEKAVARTISVFIPDRMRYRNLTVAYLETLVSAHHLESSPLLLTVELGSS